MKKYILTIPFLIILLTACGQTDNNSISVKWIYDFENVLNTEQEKMLDSIINDFGSKTTNEIAIVTTDNIGEFDKMVEFAVDFGNKHGIGKKNKNNGLIIVFSKKMRQTFIATGYGTENILKDDICKKIVDSTMIPYFKNMDYFGGIKAGLEECISKWK